jgi:hypothetical protein
MSDNDEEEEEMTDLGRCLVGADKGTAINERDVLGVGIRGKGGAWSRRKRRNGRGRHPNAAGLSPDGFAKPTRRARCGE